MSGIDWICLTIVFASLLLGLWRGFLYEASSLAGWVIAFIAAQWAAPVVGVWLPITNATGPLPYVAGFVLTFIGVAFICGMLASLIRKAAKSMGLRPVDRVFGALFGVLRGVLLLLVLAAGLLMTPMRDQSWWRASVSGPLLEQVLAQIKPMLPDGISDRLSV